MVMMAVFLVGGFALASQIILIRELLGIYYGNELSISFMLASWMFWVSAGSFGVSWFVERMRRPARLLIFLCIMLGWLLPVTIMGMRYTRVLFDTHPGQIAGPVPIMLSSFLLLSLIGICNGACFAIGACVIGQQTRDREKSIGKVYILEALGSGMAGAVLHFILIDHMNPVILSVLLFYAMHLLALFLAVRKLEMNKLFQVLSMIGILTAAGCILNVTYPGWNILDTTSLHWKWGDLDISAEKDSRYGRITVVHQNNQISVYENGLLQFTYPDALSAEEQIHYALLQHPSPRRVLLIGSGLGGGLNELVKYPDIAVDYVELDPKMISMAREYMPQQAVSVLNNPAVTVHLADGRAFLRQTDSMYDVIIAAAPDPGTAQINRYYTKEFFSETRKHLAGNGIIFFQVTSSPNYISDELGTLLNSLNATLKTVFPHVIMLPGEQCRFIASSDNGFITRDPEILVNRLKNKNIETLYVNEYYLPYDISPERSDYLDLTLAQIQNKTKTMINSDLKPVCYYFDIVLFSASFQSSLKTILLKLQQVNWTWSIPAIVMAFGLTAVFISRKSQYHNLCILVPVGTTGMAEITFEILILFVFQSFFGILYSSIGLILSAFMVGLAMGGYTSIRFWTIPSRRYRWFIILQVALIAFIAILTLNIYVMSSVNLPLWVCKSKFTALTMFAGFLGGAQFPVAAALYKTRKKQVGKTAGILYGTDLLGSCIGALVYSTILIPLAGVYMTLLVLGIISMGSLLVIIAGRNTYI